MDYFSIIALAAGKGTRMKSEKAKVLHSVAGTPMITRVVKSALSTNPDKLVVVIGHQGEAVKSVLSEHQIEYSVQSEQLGTGHAIASTKGLFEGYKGYCLILCGDTPLIQASSIKMALESHTNSTSKLTVVTTHVNNPFGYGRIIRDNHRAIIGIVEEKDATGDQRRINEINTGIYVVDSELLFRLVDTLKNHNTQGEYYLTDIVGAAVELGLDLNTHELEDSSEVTGINTMAELAYASKILWDKKRTDLMSNGVHLVDPRTVYVDSDVQIGHDTVVYQGVNITGATIIGKNCIIEPGVFISDCLIGDNVHVKLSSRLDKSEVNNGASVGPMAHLRPDSKIGEQAKIGNFVEVKKTDFGKGSKASHLTYLGDSKIGQGVNIGCGTITCNYDGRTKHTTEIGDNSFIGSDVQLVAPVKVGKGCIIAAGSAITKDVPDHSMGVTRTKQRIYPLRESQKPENWND